MVDVNSPQFGQEIKDTLSELNITQTELAKKMNITVAYLSDILMDKRRSRRRRVQIAEVLAEIESEAVRI